MSVARTHWGGVARSVARTHWRGVALRSVARTCWGGVALRSVARTRWGGVALRSVVLVHKCKVSQRWSWQAHVCAPWTKDNTHQVSDSLSEKRQCHYNEDQNFVWHLSLWTYVHVDRTDCTIQFVTASYVRVNTCTIQPNTSCDSLKYYTDTLSFTSYRAWCSWTPQLCLLLRGRRQRE